MRDEHEWVKFYESFIDQWINLTMEEEARLRNELHPSRFAPVMYLAGGLLWVVTCFFISSEFDIAWYLGIALTLVGFPVVAIGIPYLLITLPLTTFWYEPKVKDYERFRDAVQNAIHSSYQDCLTEYGKEVRRESQK